MQPDAELGKPLRARHRVHRSRRADHQARDGQDAIAMRPLDGLVDRDVAAEIVGTKNKAFGRAHLSSSSRRKPGPTPRPLRP